MGSTSTLVQRECSMLGLSYFAVSQQMVAALQPPHLKAICPLFAITDCYRDLHYHGGILSANFLTKLLSLAVP